MLDAFGDVVDEHIEPPLLLRHAFEEGFDLPLVRVVCARRDADAAARRDHLGRLLYRFGTPREVPFGVRLLA